MELPITRIKVSLILYILLYILISLLDYIGAAVSPQTRVPNHDLSTPISQLILISIYVLHFGEMVQERVHYKCVRTS